MIKYVVLFTLILMGSAYADSKCGVTDACAMNFKAANEVCFGRYGIQDDAELTACLQTAGENLSQCANECFKRQRQQLPNDAFEPKHY